MALVEPFNQRAAQGTESGVAGFQAAVADQVASVVGELEYTHAKIVIQRDAIGVFAEWRRILESIDQAKTSTLFRHCQISRAAHLQQVLRMRGDLRVPVGDVADRLIRILGIAADTADGEVDRSEATGADIVKRPCTQR